MTQKDLEEYRSKLAEIRELRTKLEHLDEDDSFWGNDTVFDYRSGYPKPQAVVGVDWQKYDRASARYRQRIDQLQQECALVEEFVENLEDSLMRRIFRMYYLEGKSQREISECIHLDRSVISKKISRFFKFAHNAQNAHV